jgi:uncharacterized membrane protein YeaQ/YmgE (transglycosylase-associated protein family)
MFFIFLIIIGGVVGWLVSSFTEGQGVGLGGNVAVGTVGSVATGLLFGTFGERLVGPGPIFIATLLAAAIGALVLVLIVRFVKK